MKNFTNYFVGLAHLNIPLKLYGLSEILIQAWERVLLTSCLRQGYDYFWPFFPEKNEYQFSLAIYPCDYIFYLLAVNLLPRTISTALKKM